MTTTVRERVDRLIPKRRVTTAVTLGIAALTLPVAGVLFPLAFEAGDAALGFVVLGAGLLVSAACLVLAILALRRARRYGWNEPAP